MKPKPLLFNARSASLTLLGLLVAGLCAASLWADEPKPAAPAKAAAKEPAKPAAKKLTGAELYAINCNRCHPERYPTEFTASQWETIMIEMRVRANLPARQSREILKYLKEDAGGN